MLMRVVKGFQSMGHAVKLAPDIWMALLVRLAVKSEFQVFTMDIISALTDHSSKKIPDAFWILISRLIHKSTAKH